MLEQAQTMDWKGLVDSLRLLPGLELIKYLAIVTAVVTGVGRVVLWVFVLVYDFLRFKLIPIAKAYQITLEVRRSEILGLADFYCLIVRYGSDWFLRDLATDNDRKDGKLQLRVKRCRLKYDKEGNASLRFELPVHRRIGTQFKCFAEPKAGCADKVLNILTGCSKLSGVEHSQSVHSDRIYFLLNAPYAQVYSADRLVGKRIINNFVFPE